MVHDSDNMISVEVAYAARDSTVHVINIKLPEGATVQRAIEESGLLQQCPEINLGQNKVGIFSEVCDLDTIVPGDSRVEIYRPLTADPKEARRRRAQHNPLKS